MQKSSKGSFFYGWAIVGASFLALTTYGVFYSYGVFFTAIEADFPSWSKAATSSAFSVFMAVYSVAAIGMGWLCDRYGPRMPLLVASLFIGLGVSLCSQVNSIWQLILFFGIVGGLGHSAIFVVPVSTVVRWFAVRRGLAVGLAAAGIGVGLFVVPVVGERLIAAHGWRWAFVVVGIAFLAVNVVAASILKRNPEDMALKPRGQAGEKAEPGAHQPPAAGGTTGLTLAQAAKTRGFWVIYVAFVLAFAAETFAAVHAKSYAEDVGISSSVAALALSFIGVGNIVGRIGMGALSDRIGRIRVLAIALFIETAALFLLPAARSDGMLCLLMGILGLGYGGWAVVFAPITGEFFGLTHLGKIMGALFTTGAVSGFMGPLLGGYIVDVTDSYEVAFLFAGSMAAIALVLILFARPPSKAPSS